MSATDKVIERIRRLLRLAQSDNRGEAANALAAAQKMMHAHRVEQAHLDAPDDEQIQIWRDEPLESAAAIAPWRQAIGGAIAEINDSLCLVYRRRQGERPAMVIVGRRSDLEICTTMYRWIVDTIDDLATRTSRRVARRMRRVGMGRRWMNSFRHGAAGEVEERLYRERRGQRAQLAADPKTSKALAVRHDAVHEWAEENLDTREPRGRSPDLDADAFELGAQVGRLMPLRDSDSPE